MKILITGSEGYIGQALIRRLKRVRPDDQFYTMDLKTGEDILTSKIWPGDKIETVIHLAAQADVQKSIKKPTNDAQHNIIGTLRVLERYPEARVIIASSAAAKDPQSPYGIAKRAIELYAKMLHKNAVVLRFPNVFGRNGRGVVDALIREEKPTIYGDGTQTRDFVHVDDIVGGILAATYPSVEPGLYEMGSEKATAIMDLVAAISARKQVNRAEAREGEIQHSVLQKTLPNWEPTIDVIEYLDNRVKYDL